MSLEKIFNRINNLKNASLKKEILKEAGGILSNPQDVIYEAKREKSLMRDIKLEQNHNLGYEKPEAISADEVLGRRGSMSTRYAPDMPGVQTMRYSDGVYQNPYNGKMYDFNEGFEMDGMVFPGGSPSLQSSIMTLASEFKSKGLHKEARLLKVISSKFEK